jgi:hypothetical protein
VIVATLAPTILDWSSNTGPYIRQEKHQFYYTVCKGTNNVREANDWLTMIGKSPILRQCHRITSTSQDSNTPEGLESQFSVGIHRIPVELPHSTKLELRKLYRTQTDSGTASALELLWGPPTSQEAPRPSELRLPLYSTRTKLGSSLEAKLTLSFGTRALFWYVVTTPNDSNKFGDVTTLHDNNKTKTIGI